MNPPHAASPGELAALMLLPVLVLTVAALVAAQILALVARLKVGAQIAADRAQERARRAAITVLAAGLLAWLAFDRQIWLVPALLCLGSALLVAFTAPSASTAVLGSGGVQRGWHARRYAALEEWRLTGDHLRFRLHGEWTSVPCPPARQAEIRAKLTALVPERESPFQD
jgi:hypothetical protein